MFREVDRLVDRESSALTRRTYYTKTVRFETLIAKQYYVFKRRSSSMKKLSFSEVGISLSSRDSTTSCLQEVIQENLLLLPEIVTSILFQTRR